MNTTEKTNAPKWVAYYRVSTKKQGLGLEAQRVRVMEAAKEAGAVVIAEYSEKVSGKVKNRPELTKAMNKARKGNAVVVVAKHDRLSRDLADAADFVFKKGVEFAILNLPAEAMSDPLLFGVYFGLADKEAKLISERTKAALAVRKAQGVKLGNPNGAIAMQTEEVKTRASEARKRKADENPNNLVAANEIRRLFASGKQTLQKIADHLNAQGYSTASGKGDHTRKSVQLLIKRYNIAI